MPVIGRSAVLRAQRKQQGRCQRCGKQPVTGKFATCLPCRLKVRSSRVGVGTPHRNQWRLSEALHMTEARDRAFIMALKALIQAMRAASTPVNRLGRWADHLANVIATHRKLR